MRDNDIAHLLLTRVKGAVADAESLGMVTHSGLRGRLRELVLRQLMVPILPPTCLALSGTCVDTCVRQQAPVRRHTEDDILIVDPELVAPMLYTEGNGIVPYDSVLCRIEVKSRLKSSELEGAIEAACDFRKLTLAPCINEPTTGLPPQMLFAFSSDADGNEHERFMRILQKKHLLGDIPPLQGLCVAGKGFWHFSSTGANGQGWLEYTPAELYSDVVVMLGLILNSIPWLRTQRHRAYTPTNRDNVYRGVRLGDYIIEKDTLTPCACKECRP
jgi:hypothetical protein